MEASKPTYDELVQLHFDAKYRVICENSSDIAADTLALWRECSAWAGQPLVDTTGCVERYLEWEAEDLAGSRIAAGNSQEILAPGLREGGWPS